MSFLPFYLVCRGNKLLFNGSYKIYTRSYSFLKYNQVKCGRCIHSPSILKMYPYLSSFRNYNQVSRKEQKLKLKDNIPNQYELIYSSKMDSYLTVTRAFSNFSMITIFGLGVMKFSSVNNMFLYPVDTNFLTAVTNDYEFACYMIGFILVNAAIQGTIMRFPKRVYCSEKENKYIAVFNGLLPLQNKFVHFKNGDVERIDPYGILPWRDSRYKIAGKRVLLLENRFRSNADLNRMLKDTDT